MIELTKISTEKAHKFFQTLAKLNLINLHDPVTSVWAAWRHGQKYECKKK